jgi:hypothetical protein
VRNLVPTSGAEGRWGDDARREGTYGEGWLFWGGTLIEKTGGVESRRRKAEAGVSFGGLFIERRRGVVEENDRTRFLGKRCRRSRLPILGPFHTAQNRRDFFLQDHRLQPSPPQRPTV